MSDILKEIDLHVRCGQCDRGHRVPLSIVAQSQRLLEEGCPGSIYECAATYFATLVAPEALEALAQAWRQVEDSVFCVADGFKIDTRLSVEVVMNERNDV